MNSCEDGGKERNRSNRTKWEGEKSPATFLGPLIS